MKSELRFYVRQNTGQGQNYVTVRLNRKMTELCYYMTISLIPVEYGWFWTVSLYQVRSILPCQAYIYKIHICIKGYLKVITPCKTSEDKDYVEILSTFNQNYLFDIDCNVDRYINHQTMIKMVYCWKEKTQQKCIEYRIH